MYISASVGIVSLLLLLIYPVSTPQITIDSEVDLISIKNENWYTCP